MSSRRFPRFSLQEAIDRVRKVYHEEASRPFNDEVAVKHMGYAGISGASKTMLGAVRGYGLIVGRATDMKVSQDAVIILVDEQAEDQSERREALLRCLQSNSLYAELLERFGNSSSEMNVAAYLQKSQGLSPSSASQAAKSFKDSLVIVFSDDEDYESNAEAGDNPTASPPVNSGGKAQPASVLPEEANTRQETFTLAGSKSVTIQFPNQMSAEDYEDFRDWLKILERKVGRSVVNEEKDDGEN